MSGAAFNLFAYGTLRHGAAAVPVLEGASYVRSAVVEGTLYDIEGRHPALMLYGSTLVKGDIWRCPADLLVRLDAYEAVPDGLFRRVAVDVDGVPCWTFVAGPALARRLTPSRRIMHGDWLEQRRAG